MHEVALFERRRGRDGPARGRHPIDRAGRLLGEQDFAADRPRSAPSRLGIREGLDRSGRETASCL